MFVFKAGYEGNLCSWRTSWSDLVACRVYESVSTRSLDGGSPGAASHWLMLNGLMKSRPRRVLLTVRLCTTYSQAYKPRLQAAPSNLMKHCQSPQRVFRTSGELHWELHSTAVCLLQRELIDSGPESHSATHIGVRKEKWAAVCTHIVPEVLFIKAYTSQIQDRGWKGARDHCKPSAGWEAS